MSESIPRPEPPSRRGSCLSFFLAAMLFLVSAAGLYALSLGALLPVLVIAGLIFSVTGFHYLVWGWWLGRMIQQEAEEEGAHEP